MTAASTILLANSFQSSGNISTVGCVSGRDYHVLGEKA
jgi:hypothetical protein